MIENFKLSIWDYLVTFFVGILLILVAIIHYILFFNTDIVSLTTIIQNISIATAIILIPTIFVLGLIIDCLAIAIDDIFLGKLTRWIFVKISSEVRKTNIDIETWSNLITTKYLPVQLRGKINPYFWCKYYLEQNNIGTPEQVFTSKYGFYRVVATFSIAHIVIVPMLYGLSISTFALMLLALILGIIFEWRSNRFYYHAGKAIYCNYITNKEHKK